MGEYDPTRSFYVECMCVSCQTPVEHLERIDPESACQEGLALTKMHARRLFLAEGWMHDTSGRWFAPGHYASAAGGS